MKLVAREGYGPPIEFECFDNWLSRWTCEPILDGKTYPALPGVDDVSMVVDVGANCGAASVYFARCYPAATVHAIEPGSAPFDLLARNTRDLENVQLHKLGLFSVDREATLYAGIHDAGTASIFARAGRNSERSEQVTLREARRWLDEQGIESIDVLKVDVEGSELEILGSIRDVLPTVRALYVEYDSVRARRVIDHWLEPTHELVHGAMFLDHGEVIYAHRDLLTDPDPIVHFFRARVALDFQQSQQAPDG